LGEVRSYEGAKSVTVFLFHHVIGTGVVSWSGVARGKESKRFRLLNGDGGSMGDVDVYENPENRIVQ